MNRRFQPFETTFGNSRVIFGADAVERAGVMAREVGATRALVVTDPRVREVGHVDRALAVLRQAQVATEVFDRVEANPTTGQVAEAVIVAREHGTDCIIGLGGGSALDCAKAVNFLLTNGGRMEDYWGSGKASQPMLPSIGIPTTAGTGSEAQSYALICQEGTGVKMACGDRKAMFLGVILDPKLVRTVPRPVAATAGIDAIAHAVESYVCTRRNPLSQMFAREAWRLLESSFPQALADRQEDEVDSWSAMVLGAFMAGAAIEQSMLGAAHACANPLTARFPIAHGAAVGLMLPHVIRFNAAHVGELYDELYQTSVSGDRPGLLDERVTELRSYAGLAESLRDYQIPQASLPELAADAENQWTAGFNPRPVSREELFELYESAY